MWAHLEGNASGTQIIKLELLWPLGTAYPWFQKERIMKSNILKILMSACGLLTVCFYAGAQVTGVDGQVIDTTQIYGERADSLEAAVFTGSQAGNYLPRGKEIRTEVISAAGLCKMACCNLAESFENSASVTVGYSDAVTGARQIRLLGLSGVYTQMLDENRPVMRGLSAPFGLSYVPGQWLESIQIAKGCTSVINGVESMTGQINMEHRKPTDEKPLFINYSAMSDSKMDFNIASSLQLNEAWSTVLLGHVSGNFAVQDMNKDGFMDDPRTLQFNLSNRWLYYAPSGVQVRFGVRGIRDSRLGGQFEKHGKEKIFYDRDRYSFTPEEGVKDPWGSKILNRSLDGYLKVGVPLNEDNSQNIALVADYNYQNMDSDYGKTSYYAGQHSSFLNLLYQNEVNESHKFTVGASAVWDRYNETFNREYAALKAISYNDRITNFATAGVFGEYTYHYKDIFSLIAGVRGDMYYGGDKAKFRASPRLTLKYTPIEQIVIRANGGRGLRFSTPFIDNIGVFATGKEFRGEYENHLLEDAWTFGGNVTYYIPVGASSNTYISFDYFRTQFVDQMIVDYEHYDNVIDFYSLKSIGGRAFTDNYQLDFSIEPVQRFTITLTGRYTNARTSLAGKSGLVEKPMTGRYKGVINLQYATKLNKWIFDFTASVNGSSRLYDFMAADEIVKHSDGQLKVKKGHVYSTAYPLLYAQVTKRFKGVDIYVGGENLTNFHQHMLVLGEKDSSGKVNPRDLSFDASCVWGPLMGIKVYAGVRFTLWKTE